ncbi:MAG: hypothetical protein NTX03_05740, partial [Bacteroidetes bacterium]|nr:hypothetical protein [Bacteroidota bacterium]
MKKLLYSLLFLIPGIILMSSSNVSASHMMGSDITWKCKGNSDTFEIKITVYRDCNGIDLGNQSISYKLCGGSLTAISNTKMSTRLDITPTCKKSCTRCKSSGCSFPYGIERFIFTATLIIKKGTKSTCCDIILSWEQCCRNGAITTGISGNFYIEGKMNRCAKPCDNSPYYTNPPVAIVCKDQCITFNNGVNDDDVDSKGNADSLVYILTDPLSGSGSKLSYSSPYSKAKPLKFSGWPNANAKWDPPKCEGFHLDSATGDLQFKATKIDQTVVAFLVQEWAKDSTGKVYKKGETRRDVQLIIIVCKTNKVPTLSGIDGTSLTQAHFCVNQYKCFTINSYDADLKDTVKVDWNKGIPGATFIVETKKQHPKSIFCWKPGQQHVRSYPYSFVVNAVDDACPVNGRTSRSYQVYVHPSPEAQVIDSFKQCGDAVFFAFPKNNSSITKYVWSLEDYDHSWTRYGNKVNHHYRKPGTYKWRVDYENSWKCISSDSGSITIPPYVEIDLPRDTTVCLGSNTKVNISTTYGKGKPRYFVEWSNGDTGVNSIAINITKDTSVYVKITDQQVCSNGDTMHIHAQKPPAPNVPDIRSCQNTIVYLQDTFIKYKANYVWTDASSGGYLGNSSSQPIKDSGSYALKVTDTLGCVGFDTANVFFNPEVRIIPNKFNGCFGDTIQMDGGIGDPNAIWTWKTFDNPPIVKGTSKKLSVPLTTNKDQYFLVSVYHTYKGVTCADSDTISVTVSPKPSLTLYTIPDLCLNYEPLDLSTIASRQGGTWSILSPSPAAGVQLNFLYPAKAGIGTHKLQYYYKSPATGCDTTLFTQVTIDDIPKVFAGND